MKMDWEICTNCRHYYVRRSGVASHYCELKMNEKKCPYVLELLLKAQDDNV